jgi:class 3 adenylate cyclase/tetratricopeptide (TPR) repeat protein
MRCFSCGSDNREGRKFCVECGQPLRAACPSCGAPTEPAEKFCGDCGAALITAQPRALQSPRTAAAAGSDIRIAQEHAGASLEGERKTVTALFADIKGSTELMRDLDPEDARAILDPVLNLMMEAVHSYGGYVAQSTGDGIFALFGAPVAHEDHPQRALHAALAIQEELRRYADGLCGQGKITVEARVGVNTGEVVVRTIETGGHTEYTPVGHVTNLAARMQTAAPAGSIAASEATQRLCEAYFEFRTLGPTSIKGFDAPVEVYEVVRAGPLRTHFEVAARRGLTRFVGREREMAAIAAALEHAVAGRGQVVAAVGEAGAGKSRLLYELKATIPDGFRVLEGHSVSHGKASSWLPVIEMLKSYFELTDQDDDRRRSDKVEAKLRALDPALAETSRYILGLMGIAGAATSLAMMDARIRRQRTLETLKRIVIGESLRQPVVLIFEDLHWIDAETQELLDLIAEGAASARILMLVNYRPEYRHQWGGKSYYLQLRLDPLGGKSADEMLRALLGEDASLQSLKRLILEKTGGNPFFIEEMVRALIEQGVLMRDGALRLTRRLTEIRIPPTVHDILASRIDALPPSEKGLLQTLAVIGKDFQLNLVRHICAIPDDELKPVLKSLQAGEFIYEQPALEEAQYTFKHALTQEVAYNSVLIERRRVLHERTAQMMETLFKDRIDEHLTELAHHYGRSANTRKAVEYLFRSGNQATSRSAFSQAITQLFAALALLPHLPNDDERARTEIAIQSRLLPSIGSQKGWATPELEPLYARARELCAQIRDPALTFPVLFEQWITRWWKLELHEGMELADQLLAMAEQVGDRKMLLSAHWACGTILFERGELVAANEHLEKAVADYDLHQPLPDKQEELRRVAALGRLYLVWHQLGYADRARAKSREALKVAERSSASFILAVAIYNVAQYNLLRGDAAAALKDAEQAMDLIESFGLMTLWPLTAAVKGGAMIARGCYEEGIAGMRQGVSAFYSSGATPPAWTMSLLASALGKVGRLEEGLRALDEGFASVAKTREQRSAPSLYQVKGELLLAQNSSNVAEGERAFRTAIEIAQRQSAKMAEIGATTSLARLLMEQDRRDEARTMLADIYGWFTEGFDTADLKEAKALLDELRV